jgi:hypothetical protein
VAFTTAITAYTASNNPGTILISVVVSGITAAAPYLIKAISAVMTEGRAAFWEAGGEIAAIIAAITIVIAGLTAGFKALTNYIKEDAEE